jgi:hypothetical protein
MNMDFNAFTSSGYFQPTLWALAAIAIVILLRASNMFRYIPEQPGRHRRKAMDDERLG